MIKPPAQLQPAKGTAVSKKIFRTKQTPQNHTPVVLLRVCQGRLADLLRPQSVVLDRRMGQGILLIERVHLDVVAQVHSRSEVVLLGARSRLHRDAVAGPRIADGLLVGVLPRHKVGHGAAGVGPAGRGVKN